MRRISIGSSKDQRRVNVLSSNGSNRRSSLPSGLVISKAPHNHIHSGKDGYNSLSNGHNDETEQRLNGVGQRPLPKIHRLSSSNSDADARLSSPRRQPIRIQGKNTQSMLLGNKINVSSPGKYPTHQPQYGAIGLLPNVHLHKQPRAVLTDKNSSMVKGSLSVKIAPPDVLKPPTPVFVQVKQQHRPPEDDSKNQSNPCDTETVISALREKRKRNIGDEETVVESPEHKPVSKRMRHTDDSNGDEPSESGNNHNVMNNHASGNSGGNRRRKVVGVKNALEASFSSSKRWIEKMRDYSLNTSRDSSVISHGRRSSGENHYFSHTTSRNSSLNTTPRHSITLDDDGLPCDRTSLSNTSTPVPGTSGRTTPLTEGEQSDILPIPSKRKSLVIKDGNTKRRLIPSSSKPLELSYVPGLRHELTIEDFERDRKADLDRVKQMLQDVDEENNKQGKKKSVIFGSGSLSSSLSSENSLTGATTSLAVSTSSTAPCSSNPVQLSISNSTNTTATTTSSSNNKPAQSSMITHPLISNALVSSSNSTPTTASSGLVPTTSASSASTLVTSSILGSSVLKVSTPATTAIAPTLNSAISSTSSLIPSTTGSLQMPGNTLSGGITLGKPVLNTSSAPATTTFGSKPTEASHSSSSVPSPATTSQGGFTFGGGSNTATISMTSAPAAGGFSFGKTGTGGSNSISTAVETKITPSPAGFSFGQTSVASTNAPTTTASTGFTLGSSNSLPKPSSTPGFSFGSSATVTNSSTITTNLPTQTSNVGGFSFNAAPKTGLSTTPSMSMFPTGNNSSSVNNPVSSSSIAINSFGTGKVQSSTSTPSAGGFSFNATSSFGAQTTAASVTPAFGGSSQPTGGLTFGASQNNKDINTNQTTSLQFGQTAVTGQNTGSMFSFGNNTSKPNETKPSSTFTFGGGNSNATSAPTAGVFSATQAQQNQTAAFQFGATQSNQTQQSNSVFGFGQTNNNDKPQTGASFTFGVAKTTAATNSQQPSPFNFGQANTANISNSASTGFNFGQNNTTAQNPSQPGFAFGQNNTQQSAQPASGAFNFGQSANGFGAASSNIAQPFGTAQNSTNNPAQNGGTFTFGTGGQNSNNNSMFGATTGFGNTNGASTAFGGSNPAFGNASQTNGGIFTNGQAKPFDLSKSGSNLQIAFSASGNQPLPTPQFGTPNIGPPNFGTPKTPMLNVGTSGNANRPRVAARRRNNRK